MGESAIAGFDKRDNPAFQDPDHKKQCDTCDYSNRDLAGTGA